MVINEINAKLFLLQSLKTLENTKKLSPKSNTRSTQLSI